MKCEFPTNSNKCFYVCKHSLNMIKVNKIPTFYIPKNIIGIVVIEYVKKLNVLKERPMSNLEVPLQWWNCSG